MDLPTYADNAVRTLSKTDDDNIHMILGMVTEVGELADVYKKYLAYGKPIDIINVEEEVGDLMWYIINFCTLNGFDLPTLLDLNIAKLRERYPDKFSSDRAINRNVSNERSILEIGLQNVPKES
jgi:NTP pyrophosphatase (non-canonical NTP hydrolase)